MPQFEIVRDSAGAPCLRAGDAQAVADALAADPAQPFHFNTNCGTRAQLMAGRLATNGFPPEMIYHIHSHALDSTGIDDQTHRNRPGADFQKLVGAPSGTGTGDWQVPGTNLKVHFVDAAEVYVWDDEEPRGNHYDDGIYGQFKPGFALRADGESDARYREHHTIGLPVLNEATGKAEVKVIDPHLTTPVRLLSFAEWKRLHCPDALILSGPAGKPQNIVVEDGGLRRNDIERLGNLLGIKSSDPAQIKRALSTMDDVNADRITAQMLGSGNTQIRYGYLNPSWADRSEAEKRQFVSHLESELEPLVVLEKSWRRKFMQGPAAAPA